MGVTRLLLLGQFYTIQRQFYVLLCTRLYNEFVINFFTILIFIFSVAPDKNKKITSLMKKADKATTFKKTCGYLSDAELVEYLTMFPNPEKLFKEVPVVRKRRELWNKG